ncbi:MAG: dephospho-CoA kinase [Ruminococcus sp.]|nr:dephospho-CoA kinase [Ruminococcus sp.]
MKHYKLIGLTGQSGAGKSTVAEVFAKLGAYVINADKIVAELYNAGSPCLKAVAAEFGQDILNPDGTLDRRKLAQRAFASRERTDALNRLVHPFVTARLFELLRGAEGIVVFDAPQLFEADADVICDAVVAVTADKDIRVNRIIKRDSLSEEQAMLRVNAQHGEEYFRARADYIIENNFDEESLRTQAEKVYNKLDKG